MTTNAGIQFIRASGDDSTEKSPQDVGVPQPPLELPLKDSLTLIALPAPADLILPPKNIWQVMDSRRTLRKYQDAPLSLEELTAMLWYTQGVKAINSRPATERTVPSAGARHPFETYLIVSKVEGLQPGLYQYVALQHKITLLQRSDDLVDEVFAASHSQNHVRTCSVSFWWAANVLRTTWRYRTRGYRYIFMDAGHICQNLYLVAEALGCGICPIGSFSDEKLNRIFGCDGEERLIVYGATVGKR